MDTVKRHLTLISSLTPGYTINVKTKTLVYHYGFLTGLRRTLLKENRESCLRFISSTVDQAIGSITTELGILAALKESRMGISSLKETYNSDSSVAGEVDNILARIDNTIKRFENRIITQIEEIPSLLKFMESRVDAHEFDGLCIVKQTPIISAQSSPALSQPETPVTATPACVTLPPTPPSSPTRELDQIVSDLTDQVLTAEPKHMLSMKNLQASPLAPLGLASTSPLLSGFIYASPMERAFRDLYRMQTKRPLARQLGRLLEPRQVMIPELD